MSLNNAFDSTSHIPLLVLGKGFIGSYVVDLCTSSSIPVASTTTTGRDDTIPFKFDPLATLPSTQDDRSSTDQYYNLPTALTVLITFPMMGSHVPTVFSMLYAHTHPLHPSPNLILLGSTSAWKTDVSVLDQKPGSNVWLDRHSPIDIESDARLQAEQTVLQSKGVVLNLAGLWGDKRHPRNWVNLIAPTKLALASKTSLHLVHGMDVARIVLALISRPFSSGERWIVTDLNVYDWWQVVLAWSIQKQSCNPVADENNPAIWVKELMEERGVRGLPRSSTDLLRALDSRDVWSQLGLVGPCYTLMNDPCPVLPF
ncbi:hypothetical protein BATDEDRAFT_36793 [Batrachochytrium dendrobatidis JAM81]|uniref:Uncharacterized protein n=2 Tax=Batrachochytrium dendrobatidis TaxID=109871 RepID=F4NZF6_BATDJ|nr:uncharacterized protein BATDEDRAFT_36793 [Batrachochytrium dendrobatidis JAM81]EGF81427.1 hypothetical protein BATDEDRAFT_36793 [Batrachochytrium dendrobatidis JAM81]OAJ38498.1 hypothetical protein BDEG_22417 [Batrachochytrium dendrobatidis JEL423]|eukprot:XP_006678051.1 hypothetical protein BATDEDRAFT_36793 [Batrachochytrium dendrobatidis JAM81]